MFIQQLFLVPLNMIIFRDISYTLAVARFSPISPYFKLYLLYSHRCFLYILKFLYKGHISKLGSGDIFFSCIILHLMTLTASSGLPLSLIFWSEHISMVCCPQYFHKPQIIFFIYPSKDQSSHLWWWIIYSRGPLKPDLHWIFNMQSSLLPQLDHLWLHSQNCNLDAHIYVCVSVFRFKVGLWKFKATSNVQATSKLSLPVIMYSRNKHFSPYMSNSSNLPITSLIGQN